MGGVDLLMDYLNFPAVFFFLFLFSFIFFIFLCIVNHNTLPESCLGFGTLSRTREAALRCKSAPPSSPQNIFRTLRLNE